VNINTEINKKTDECASLQNLPQIAQLQQMNVDQPLSVPVYHPLRGLPLSVPVYHHLRGLVKLDFTN
jgi:hypothetical protein